MSHEHSKNYPRWKYKGEEKLLVQNHKEESALGPEWTNSPADIYVPPAPEPESDESIFITPRKAHKSRGFDDFKESE